MNSTPNSPTCSRRILTRTREATAITRRIEGKTYAEIAGELGVSVSGAFRLLDRALVRLRTQAAESAEKLVTLETERLDRLQCAVWDEAVHGDLPSIDRVLKIMERRAKLWGLDAARQGPEEFTEGTDIDAELQVLIGKLRLQVPSQAAETGVV